MPKNKKKNWLYKKKRRRKANGNILLTKVNRNTIEKKRIKAYKIIEVINKIENQDILIRLIVKIIINKAIISRIKYYKKTNYNLKNLYLCDY